MSELLKEKILDFCYITAIFHNFIVNSGKNIKKINLAQNEEIIAEEFYTLNQDNFFAYNENLSFIKNIDKKKYKLNCIHSFFEHDVNFEEKEKIFNEIYKKMNISIFVNKNILVKLLSTQIINFVFDINELLFLIINIMEKCHNEKIIKLTEENLISEDNIRKEKSISEIKLSKENNNLKKKIESLNNNINNNDIKLKQKNKDLEKQVNNLKQNINEYENVIQKQKETIIKSEEEIKNITNLLNKEKDELKRSDDKNYYQYFKNLNKEIILEQISLNNETFKNYENKITDLIKQNNNLDLKVFDLNSELSKLKNENKNLNLKLSELSVKVSEISKQNKDLLAKISELTEENKGLKLTISGLTEENKGLKSTISGLTEENKGLKSTISELNERISDLIEENKNLQLKNDGLTRENINLTSKISELEIKFEIENSKKDSDIRGLKQLMKMLFIELEEIKKNNNPPK